MKWLLKSVLDQLALIRQQLDRIEGKETNNMALIDDVLAGVAAQTTVITSMETFLNNLKAQLAAAGTDPVKLQTIMDGITANTAKITADITANT